MQSHKLTVSISLPEACPGASGTGEGTKLSFVSCFFCGNGAEFPEPTSQRPWAGISASGNTRCLLEVCALLGAQRSALAYATCGPSKEACVLQGGKLRSWERNCGQSTCRSPSPRSRAHSGRVGTTPLKVSKWPDGESRPGHWDESDCEQDLRER